jgi:hypothetical protein
VKSTVALAERKAALIAQSDLLRMQADLAWRTARGIVAPPAPPNKSRAARSVAATLIGLSLPLLGVGRMRRTLRTVSIGITVFRAFRAWRARGR